MDDVVLPADLVEFVESGVSVLVGTRDAQLRPQATRAFGATVHEGRKGITIYLLESVSRVTLADLRDNAQVAVTFSRPIDHRSIQLKGRVIDIRPTTDAEQLIQERYLSAWVEHLFVVGLPRAIGRRMQLFPSYAVRIALHGLFHQTPGPDAGRRMDERA
jgi:general stress protein 26